MPFAAPLNPALRRTSTAPPRVSVPEIQQGHRQQPRPFLRVSQLTYTLHASRSDPTAERTFQTRADGLALSLVRCVDREQSGSVGKSANVPVARGHHAKLLHHHRGPPLGVHPSIPIQPDDSSHRYCQVWLCVICITLANVYSSASKTIFEMEL